MSPRLLPMPNGLVNCNPLTITDPMGGVTTMVWRDNFLTEVIDPEGVRLRLEYDAHGDLSALIDADGGRAVLEHDAAGRVTRIVTPAGSAISFEYDDAGRPVARRDPDGAVRRWEYSPAGRLTASVDRSGARQSRHPDLTGQPRQRPPVCGQAQGGHRPIPQRIFKAGFFTAKLHFYSFCSIFKVKFTQANQNNLNTITTPLSQIQKNSINM